MIRKITALLVALAVLLGVQAPGRSRTRALATSVGPQPRLQPVRPRPHPASTPRPGIHEPFTPPVTAAKIRTAIDDAVYYLRSQQSPTGASIGDEGTTGLATLTMLAAGADPAADDGLKKALDWLAKQKPNNTYIRGLRANVWEYALRKLPDEKATRIC